MNADLNIVLVNPEIPQNTGNIGRTCVGLGATLHLVGRLGFSLDARDLQRAGLDYWPRLKWVRHDQWTSFESTLAPDASMVLFSTKGSRLLWDVQFRKPAYLVFGSESRGFPPSFYRERASEMVRIPIGPEIRSLNLATAAGVVAFEAARQWNLVPS